MQQLDRIILNESDNELIDKKLDKYISNNPKLASKVKEVPLKVSMRGIYEVHMNEKTDNLIMKKAIELMKKKDVDMSEFLVQYYYYDFDEVISLGEVDKQGNLLYIVRYDDKMNYIDTQVFDKKLNNPIIKNKLPMVGKATVTRITGFMKYSQLMAFLNEENAIIKKQTYIKGFQAKKLTKKERERLARKRVSVSKPKVEYNYNEAEREGLKRSYERVIESWEVEGHWRHYKKSGKRVFVKGYKKGTGNLNKKGKDFTI